MEESFLQKAVKDSLYFDIGSHFMDAPVISNAEVSLIIRKLQNTSQPAQTSSLGMNPLGEEVQKKTLRYVDKFNQFQQEDIVKKIRGEITKQSDLSDMECNLLWNLVPHKYDEAITLIPSLKDKPKDQVENFIETLNKYKQ